MKILRCFLLIIICIAMLLTLDGCFYRKSYSFILSVSSNDLSSTVTESDPVAESSKAASSGPAGESNLFVSAERSASESSLPKMSTAAQVKYKWVIPPSIECDDIVFIDAERTVTIIKKNGKLGLIDFKGNIIVPIIYNKIRYCKQCQGITCNGDLFNDKGELIGSEDGHGTGGIDYYWDIDKQKPACIYGDTCDFDYLGGPVHGLPVNDGKEFYIVEGISGVTKQEWGYEYSSDSFTGKYGVINRQGELVVPLTYDDLQDFNNGLAAAKKDGKWGYINWSGTIVVPFIYDAAIDYYSDGWPYVSAYDFSEGYAAVTKDGKWGYLNKDGNLAVPLSFEGTRPLKNKKAWVKTDGLWGVIEFK